MKLHVAVVGSGMAGLAAAHGCRRDGHAVTLFEAHEGLGMDAHVLHADGGRVDVPLRIMNTGSWRSVLALAEAGDVDTFEVKVFTSCSWSDRRTWFRSSRMPVTEWPAVGSWRYLNPRTARLALGLVRLSRLTRALERSGADLTLAECLQRERFDPLFWRGLVLPILGTICTCDEHHLRDWPARPLLSLLHGILHDGRLVRLRGGTSALAAVLARDIPAHAASPVTAVTERDDGVHVRNARGDGGRYDRVIVATQANQLDFLDPQQFAEERRVLRRVRFADGELVVHRDRRFLPRHTRDWTALNFQLDRDLGRSMFTVWVNAVEPTLAGRAPVFQTWNPLFEPDEDTVLSRVPMQRAVVDRGTAEVHEQLARWHAQPRRRVFFCGAWAEGGVPLLESAVRSADAAVTALRLNAHVGSTADAGHA